MIYNNNNNNTFMTSKFLFLLNLLVSFLSHLGQPDQDTVADVFVLHWDISPDLNSVELNKLNGLETPAPKGDPPVSTKGVCPVFS